MCSGICFAVGFSTLEHQDLLLPSQSGNAVFTHSNQDYEVLYQQCVYRMGPSVKFAQPNIPGCKVCTAVHPWLESCVLTKLIR